MSVHRTMAIGSFAFLVSSSACVSGPVEGIGSPKVEVVGADLGADLVSPDAATAITRAREYQSVGRFDSALAVLALAETKFGGDRARLALERARIYASGAMPESSLALLRQLVAQAGAAEDDTTLRQALAFQGTVEASLARLVEAERDLRHALGGRDDWPGATEAIADLGVVLLRSGGRDEGIEHLRRARSRFIASGDLDGVATIERNLARIGAAIESR